MLVWLFKNVFLERSDRIPLLNGFRRLSGFFASLRMTKKSFLSLGIVLLLFSATISMIISPNLRAAAGLWKAYIIEPIFLFIIFITTFQKKDRRAIVTALSITVLATGCIALYQKFTGAWIPNPYWAAEQTRRVTSVWGFPNAIGLFTAPLIPLFVGELWRSKKEKY